jgi:hypothetical protein
LEVQIREQTIGKTMGEVTLRLERKKSEGKQIVKPGKDSKQNRKHIWS